MGLSILTQKIEAARAAGRTALIPFLPGGYPDQTRFWEEMEGLDTSGADIIEIGVPFSDPVADGPVVEEASLACLEHGISLQWILDGLKSRPTRFQAAIVLMGYYNPFLQYGLEAFASDAAEAGVSGCIIPDLPLEESAPLREALAKKGLALVYLVGLNTEPERLDLYARHAAGFVYFVSVLGTTGVRELLPEEIAGRLKVAKERLGLPIALGFGLKSPDQLKALGGLADAAVFGSALISHVKSGRPAAEFMARWQGA